MAPISCGMRIDGQGECLVTRELDGHRFFATRRRYIAGLGSDPERDLLRHPPSPTLIQAADFSVG